MSVSPSPSPCCSCCCGCCSGLVVRGRWWRVRWRCRGSSFFSCVCTRRGSSSPCATGGVPGCSGPAGSNHGGHGLFLPSLHRSFHNYFPAQHHVLIQVVPVLIPARICMHIQRGALFFGQVHILQLSTSY
jgi:hypothetical protein